MSALRFRYRVSLFLIAVLFIRQMALAAPSPDNAEAVKTRVQVRGVGKSLQVVQSDSSETKGTIVSIGESSFQIKPGGAVQPVEIAYSDIRTVHNGGMSRRTKLIIIGGIVVGAIVIAGVIIDHSIKIGPTI